MDETDRAFWNGAFGQDPGSVDVEDQFLDAESERLTPGTAGRSQGWTGLNARRAPLH